MAWDVSVPPDPAANVGNAPLRHFRARTVRQEIHPRELTLVWLVCGHLVLLPWAFGGMPFWSQCASLALSAVSLAWALRPRDYPDATATGRAPFRLYPLPKLARFPVFWLGLALLTLIAIQALNPAWVYTTDGKDWWLRGVRAMPWLPTGIEVPVKEGGPWRTLIIYASAWLLVCAVWVGFTRRHTFQILFTTLVANGFALAGAGMLQRLKGNGRILGLFEAPTSYFVATIPYKNHAAAYFNILLGLAAGLSFWHFGRSLRRLEKSSPAGVFAFMAVAIAIMVLFSFSRAGTILMLAQTVIVLVIYLVRAARTPPDQQSHLTTVLVVVLLGSFVWLGSYSMKIGRVTVSLDRLLTSDRMVSITNRGIAHQATWEMARDRLAFGWGAGSFGYYFPVYQQQHPEIYHYPDGRRAFWEHAHNDYLEWLAEIGIVGLGLLALAAAYLIWITFKRYAWENPLVVFALLGLATTLAHAWVDFPFRNPAVLTTWCVLLPALGRWAELEELNVRS